MVTDARATLERMTEAACAFMVLLDEEQRELACESLVDEEERRRCSLRRMCARGCPYSS